MKKTITIIGGGTSGWLTGSMLLKGLGENFNIRIISDEKIGNIGVGEATLPCIKNVFSFLGIDEKEWLSYSRGSLKYGIKFEKWNKKKSFIHPYYDDLTEKNCKDYIKHWYYGKFFGYLKNDFDQYTSVTSHLINSKGYLSEIDKGISYHFDTNKLGEFLREWSLKRGIDYINANIVDFTQNNSKDIKTIILSDGRVMETDFVIDCSGFKSLVLEGVYNEPFIPFNDTLICDKCIVRWFKYSDDKSEREPFTTSIAMKYGWMWKIPLGDRLSVGYVFSSKHGNDKGIEKEILEEIKLEPLNDFRVLNIKTGYHKKACIKNSFAIGLSYGFIEPLESTGLFFIYSSVFKLLDIFNNIEDKKEFNNKKEKFNISLESKINNIKDFVLFHYLLNEKEGDFWKDSKNVKCSKELKNIVDNFSFSGKKFIFDEYHIEKYNIEPFFKDLSYYYIFSGMKELDIKKIDSSISKANIIDMSYILLQKYKIIKMKLKNSIKYNDYLEKFYINK